MDIVFMGTPDFAKSALEAIVDAGHNVVAVVTQPDKEKGRGKSVSMSEVKEYALTKNIPVLQPVRMRNADAIEELKAYPAQVCVVAAFGQILPKEVLEMYPLGCINIHASLLPAYRGAAPIQWAILDGLKQTGVTIMQMDVGLDTGDILMQSVIDIEPTDTGESLFDKLAILGGKAIVEALLLLAEGKLSRTPQDDSKSNYAKMLDKSMGKMDFTENAVVLERKIRGLNSWPSAYSYLGGKQLKIWKAQLADMSGQPGEIIAVDKSSFTVACKDGALRILEIQLEGKKRMEVSAFLLGYKIQVGDRLG